MWIALETEFEAGFSCLFEILITWLGAGMCFSHELVISLTNDKI